jgi:hypothetical protein
VQRQFESYGLSMTRFLASDTHPNGFRLEDLLLSLRREVATRMQKIMDDVRPEARLVVDNDVRILQLLTEALHLADASTAKLNRSFGPSQAADGGTPRIGRL